MNAKKQARQRRSKRARMKIRELQIKDSELIRIVVNKTPRHISAQVIIMENPINMQTKVIASASTLEKEIKSQCKYTGNIDAAKIVGKAIAERLKSSGLKSIDKVAFDRSGYKYHGRIKALADAARETGIEF